MQVVGAPNSIGVQASVANTANKREKLFVVRQRQRRTHAALVFNGQWRIPHRFANRWAGRPPPYASLRPPDFPCSKALHLENEQNLRLGLFRAARPQPIRQERNAAFIVTALIFI